MRQARDASLAEAINADGRVAGGHAPLRSVPSVGSSRQARGASLIEVLVALLLLSFGMLSLGAMLSFAVQAPRLSGYRAMAVNLASSHIERMRANPDGFSNGSYDKPSSYDNSRSSLTLQPSDGCAYPNCDFAAIATMDVGQTRVAVRAHLPAGGMFMLRDNHSGILSTTDGNLWIVWQEPDTRAALAAESSDNCPGEVTQVLANPRPRCLYLRFKL